MLTQSSSYHHNRTAVRSGAGTPQVPCPVPGVVQKLTYWAQRFPGCVNRRLSACTRMRNSMEGPLNGGVWNQWTRSYQWIVLTFRVCTWVSTTLASETFAACISANTASFSWSQRLNKRVLLWNVFHFISTSCRSNHWSSTHLQTAAHLPPSSSNICSMDWYAANKRVTYSELKSLRPKCNIKWSCFSWMDGWLVGWMVGWMDGWMVGWLLGISRTFSHNSNW